MSALCGSEFDCIGACTDEFDELGLTSLQARLSAGISSIVSERLWDRLPIFQLDIWAFLCVVDYHQSLLIIVIYLTESEIQGEETRVFRQRAKRL